MVKLTLRSNHDLKCPICGSKKLQPVPIRGMHLDGVSDPEEYNQLLFERKEYVRHLQCKNADAPCLARLLYFWESKKWYTYNVQTHRWEVVKKGVIFIFR